jgi:hypothetical protein
VRLEHTIWHVFFPGSGLILCFIDGMLPVDYGAFNGVETSLFLVLIESKYTGMFFMS